MESILDKKKVICACTIVGLIYLGMCLGRNVQLNMVSAQLPWGILDIVCSTAASAVILWISYQIMPAFPKTENFLIWFGKNSLIVLCFHLIEMVCIPFEGVIERGMAFLGMDNRMIALSVIFILKVIWACGAIVIVGKIRFLRFVFGKAA